jgi:hypothetical protein
MRPILDEVQQNFSQLIQDKDSPILRTVIVNSKQDSVDAHMSLLLAYSHTWIMQHLASLGIHRNNKEAAKNVFLGTIITLSQLQDIHWMRAYFQPQKSSPDRLGGIFARRIEDKALSTLNVYAYLTSTKQEHSPNKNFEKIRESSREDFKKIKEYYISNNALSEFTAEDGTQNEMELNAIRKIYSHYGLNRHRQYLVNESKGRVTGFASLEFSSYGLNLSEVTNRCVIHSWEDEHDTIISLALSARSRYFELGYSFCIIMVKPEFAHKLTNSGFNYTRDYACWTLHRNLFPDYVDYIEKLFRTH